MDPDVGLLLHVPRGVKQVQDLLVVELQRAMQGLDTRSKVRREASRRCCSASIRVVSFPQIAFPQTTFTVIAVFPWTLALTFDHLRNPHTNTVVIIIFFLQSSFFLCVFAAKHRANLPEVWSHCILACSHTAGISALSPSRRLRTSV